MNAMNVIPCKLCGSMPIVKVRNYHMCNDYLNTYYVICSFCGNESSQAYSVNEALRNWNCENFKEQHCA